MARVIGLDKTLRAIAGIEKALSDRAMESTLLEAAELIRDDAASHAPRGESGALQRSVKAEIGKRRNGMPNVFAAVDRKVTATVNGRLRRVGKYAHLAEGGAKSHTIVPKARGLLTGRNRSGLLSFNGQVATKVSHPGMAGTRFFRNAITNQREAARRKIEDGVKRLIESRTGGSV